MARKKTKSPKRNRKPVQQGFTQAKAIEKQARELDRRAQAIEDAVYDLKAVNPNTKIEEDTRTPGELIEIIEAQGQQVAAALAQLRQT